MIVEEWRPIPSLNGYEASSCGRIRSIDRMITDKLGRSRFAKGVIRSLTPNQKGYLKFGSKDARLVHVCVLEAFVGPRPPGMHGAHNDGVKKNNALSNLRWATPSENEADKILHGTRPDVRGSRHPQSKLTEDLVARIKTMCRDGENQTHVAIATGVKRRLVNKIVNGHRWHHVA